MDPFIYQIEKSQTIPIPTPNEKSGRIPIPNHKFPQSVPFFMVVTLHSTVSNMCCRVRYVGLCIQVIACPISSKCIQTLIYIAGSHSWTSQTQIEVRILLCAPHRSPSIRGISIPGEQISDRFVYLLTEKIRPTAIPDLYKYQNG